MKRRLIAVIGIIAIIVIAAFAVIGGNTSAKVTTVKEATQTDLKGQKVQVTGMVVDNSYSLSQNGVLTFEITDEGTTTGEKLKVSFDKGVSATFGNGVTAICTGRIDDQGTLIASELVTKCPSKYENATDALSVAQLKGYDQTMVGKTVKVAGFVSSNGLQDATQSIRFTLVDEANSSEGLKVKYSGALPEGADKNNAVLVITGALNETGEFLATDVSVKG